MANTLRLRLTGMTELRHAMTAYGDALVHSSVDAVRDAVEDTVIKAKYLAPFLTGELQRSIKGTVKTDGYSVTGQVKASAKHAHIIEFGSERVQKKPYLVAPAIANRRRMNAALRQSVTAKAPDGLGTPRLSGEAPGTPGVSID